MTIPSIAELSQLWHAFSWLRPDWLWLLLPTVLLAWWHLRSLNTTEGWRALIAPELLSALQTRTAQTRRPALGPRWPLLALALILAVLALAGPSFSRQELNTLKLTDALVIALDLSPSMLAEDIKPSRLQASHFKILDLLAARHEGYTALIAYSGSAHVVAPLSDDANTLAALVPSLTPSIMPSLGSRAEDAIEQAITLLNNAQFSGGRIALFTDEVVPEAAEKIARTMNEHPEFQLSVIAVGTEQGAPVPLNNGQFARDGSGKVVMNPLPWPALQQLARRSDGESFNLQQQPAAIDALAQASVTHTSHDKRDSGVELPQDHGYLLLPFIALFTALAFIQPAYVLRAASVLLAMILLAPQTTLAQTTQPQATLPQPPSEAASERVEATDSARKWRDLWLTPDQQASRALEAGDVETAYQRFEQAQWKATTAYQTGRYNEAEQLFSQDQSAQGVYNTANAQAQQGKLAEAIENYQRALELDPALTDAQANKTLLEELLKQQQAQQDAQQGQGASDQQQDSAQQQQQDSQQNSQQSSDQSAQNNSEQSGTPDNNSSDNSDADNNSSSSQDNSSSQANSSDNDDSSAQDDSNSAQDNTQDKAQNSTQSSHQENAQQNEQQQREQDTKSIAERAAAAEQQTDAEASGATGTQAQSEQAAADNAPDNAQEAAIATDRQVPTEEQQALEQQLRRVPDDPAGLLRNKFNYYYQLDRRKRQYDGRQQEQPRW